MKSIEELAKEYPIGNLYLDGFDVVQLEEIRYSKYDGELVFLVLKFKTPPPQFIHEEALSLIPIDITRPLYAKLKEDWDMARTFHFDDDN